MNRSLPPAKKKLALSLCLVLAAGLAAAALRDEAPVGGPPDLWRRAVAVYEANKHLLPGKVLAAFALVDGKGKPKRTSERELRYFLDSRGKVQVQLVRALDNGRDVTAKARDELRQDEERQGARPGGENRARFSLSDVPFAAEKQGQLEVVARAETASLFGMTCRRFDFSLNLPAAAPGGAKGRSLVLRGMAWIDEAGGAPVKFEFAPDPLPSKVKRLWTVFTYGPAAGGGWLLKEITSEGMGGFLFIKKSFRSRIELGDYFPAPAG